MASSKDIIARLKADTSQWDSGFGKASRTINNFRKDNLTLNGVISNGAKELTKMAAGFVGVAAVANGLKNAIAGNIETAKNFEKSISQLSSLTGLTGDKLDELKEKAIELGGSSTQSASQVADAFKLIGSQMPQLLSNTNALSQVTKQVITLSEAAGIDLQDAAKTLSVSINQMGASSNEASRYVNALAAASQKGAGDIVWLGEAITNSGTAAKAVGTGYEELLSNLEQLAQAGYDASSAGTALRSIIMNLEKQGNEKLKPSVVGLTEAFKNLGEMHLSLSGYQDIVGKLFAAQAKTLAENASNAKSLAQEITGTNTAEQQAITNTTNLSGSLANLSSAWERLNLHLNSSNGILKVFVDEMTTALTKIDEYLNKKDGIGLAIESAKGSLNDNGKSEYDRNLEILASIKDPELRKREYNRMLAVYAGKKYKAWGDLSKYNHEAEWTSDSSKKENFQTLAKEAQVQMIAYDQIMRSFAQGYKNILSGKAVSTNPTTTTTTTPTTSSSAKEYGIKFDETIKNFNNIGFKGAIESTNQMIAKLQEMQKAMDDATDALTKADIAKEMIKQAEKIDKRKISDAIFGDSFAKEMQKSIGNNLLPMEQFMLSTQSTAETAQGIADAFGAASNAISAFGGESLKAAAAAKSLDTAASIASIVASFAQAMSTAGKISIWEWIAGGLAGAASLGAMITSIKSATSGYAEGGILGGSNYSGDVSLYRGNAREMVINQADQRALWETIKGGGLVAGGGAFQMELSGDKLISVINATRKSRGQKAI